jgi:hypothetical protein
MAMQMLSSSAYQYQFVITVQFQRQLQNVLNIICAQSWIYWGGNYTNFFFWVYVMIALVSIKVPPPPQRILTDFYLE